MRVAIVFLSTYLGYSYYPSVSDFRLASIIGFPATINSTKPKIARF